MQKEKFVKLMQEELMETEGGLSLAPVFTGPILLPTGILGLVFKYLQK